ncbi:MAG: hypothetical protein HON90_11260 [Halobacteriovoraceae bacterium]|jgi:hypothetical protein|nr:hypothetical protein [Halobacteriovoraceae bacterium]
MYSSLTAGCGQAGTWVRSNHTCLISVSPNLEEVGKSFECKSGKWSLSNK